jgi:hypothetical protein
MDIDPESGYLIGAPWAAVLDRRVGSSVEALKSVQNVDIFLHDSLHTYDYESDELKAVEPNLSPGAIILSDNAHDSAALSDWAERSAVLTFSSKKNPVCHWWPGGGIGAAWADRPKGSTDQAAG